MDLYGQSAKMNEICEICSKYKVPILEDAAEALERAKFLATQAKEIAPYYQHKEVGYNYRLSNILAGIGRAQFEVLQERIDRKRLIYEMYRLALSEIDGLNFLPELEHTVSNRWLTVFTLEHNDAVTRCLQAFANENIEARPMWKPLHMQPLFKGVDFFTHKDDVSVSEQLFNKGICLPSGTHMTEDDMERVIDCLQRALMK